MLNHFTSPEVEDGPTDYLCDVYLVLTPLTSETWRDLSRSNLPISTRRQAGRQIVDAVDYVHSKGIMHRDIKPTNILFSRETQRSYLTDFGCATPGETSVDHMIGSRSFLAPEIVLLKSENPASADGPIPYDRSVDVWSLGLCFYYLFIRAQCDWDLISREVHKKIQTEIREQKQHKLLGSMLSWEAASRPKVKDILADELWVIRMSVSAEQIIFRGFGSRSACTFVKLDIVGYTGIFCASSSALLMLLEEYAERYNCC